jgi:hypothetical protein
VHFTTAQFAEAKSRLAALLMRPEFDPGTSIALRALELATLLALGEADTVVQKLDALDKFVTARSAEITSTWTFTGSKHFVKHH